MIKEGPPQMRPHWCTIANIPNTPQDGPFLQQGNITYINGAAHQGAPLMGLGDYLEYVVR